MKRILLLLVIFITISSCSVNKKPEFLGVNSIKVIESNNKFITLSANAEFLNPNIIGGDLETEDIKIFVNDNEMGSVSAKSFNVPAKKEFTIPLTAKIETKNIFSDKSLSGLLGSLFRKKIKVQYKGLIKYKVFGFSDTYNVDKTDDIKIKL